MSERSWTSVVRARSNVWGWRRRDRRFHNEPDTMPRTLTRGGPRPRRSPGRRNPDVTTERSDTWAGPYRRRRAVGRLVAQHLHQLRHCRPVAGPVELFDDHPPAVGSAEASSSNSISRKHTVPDWSRQRRDHRPAHPTAAPSGCCCAISQASTLEPLRRRSAEPSPPEPAVAG